MFSRRELDQFVIADIKDRENIMPAEVIQLWQNIEYHRAEIARQLAIFESWLDISPALQKDWDKFTQMGGISAHELAQFLDGKIIRRRPMRSRKHLRMVVNNRRRPVVLKTSPPDDDDVA
jgi:hypothetical protein